jgi:hypothetical protein
MNPYRASEGRRFPPQTNFGRMKFNKKTAVSAFRWIVLIAILFVLRAAFWLVEDTIDRLTKIICPEGWWHTSEFWAHCAYAPVSIAKHGAMYAGYAVLSLIMIHIAAPSRRALASQLLLLAMMAPPAYHLLLIRFSWVEAIKLILVLLVGGVYLAHKKAGKTDRKASN